MTAPKQRIHQRVSAAHGKALWIEQVERVVVVQNLDGLGEGGELIVTRLHALLVLLGAEGTYTPPPCMARAILGPGMVYTPSWPRLGGPKHHPRA